MKKVVFSSLLIFLFVFSGNAQFKWGAGAALYTDGGLFGVGARGHYTITDDYAAQASFHYYFDDASIWSLDLDVHYEGFDIGDLEGFQLRPFAGLNIINASAGSDIGINVSSSSTNLNLGMNGTLNLNDNLTLYIEPKIVIGNGGTIGIAAGVYF